LIGQAPVHRSFALALRMVRPLVAVLAVVQLGLYLQLAVRTISYPFPLEWMEGGTVDVVARLVRGQPLYTKPTAEYVAYIYPPLYYWVSALAARPIGVGFVAPRLVSLVSICAVFVLIAALIRRNGGDWIEALAGAALLAGTYEATERWFHLARVDSLFLALLLGGAYLLQAGATRRSAVAAGAVLFLACLTKQTALIAIGPLLLVAAIAAPRRPLIAGVTGGLLLMGTSLWLHARTDGWSTYFLYRLPQLHPAAEHGSRWFWRYDIIPVLPLALAVTAILLAATVVSWNLERRWTAALCVGGIAASWIARLHSGGAANALMPAYAALAVAMPIGIAACRERPVWRLAGTTLLAAQIALLLHGWTGIAPTAGDREAGAQYLSFLQRIDGEVLTWHQRFVATRAGKRSWGLEMAAEDVIRSRDAATAAALEADVIRVCRSGAVAGVIDPPEWLRQAVAFGPAVELFTDPAVFRPVAGARKRPDRYFPIARLSMHQPDQAGGHGEIESHASHPERPAAK